MRGRNGVSAVTLIEISPTQFFAGGKKMSKVSVR
jgi:hypothetical protein